MRTTSSRRIEVAPAIGKGDRVTHSRASWMVRVLAIYAASRVISAVAFWFGWREFDRDEYPIPNGASFWSFMARAWDGRWYAEIAETGYPSELPRDAEGAIRYNPWAFFPLYPLIARSVMRVTGLSWEVVGPGLSVAFGALAMLALVKLLRDAAPSLTRERPALVYTAVAALSFFPAAGVFSMAYSDSLAMLLVLGALWCLCRRHYVRATVPVLLLGFTRAVALPIAAAVVWHVIQRWRTDGRESIGRSEWFATAALCVVAMCSGFAWMVVTAIALGSPDAYLQAQSPWRRDVSSTTPFSGWTAVIENPIGWSVFILFCLGVIVLTFSQFVRRLGPELQAWSGSYMAYVVAATALGPSTPRYTMLAIGFPIAMAGARRGLRGDLNVIVTLAGLMVGWILLVCLVKGFTA